MADGSIEIVLPACSDDRVSADLRRLTRLLMEAGAETSGGLLGGEYGYGAFFENDVFMMHPFCWCDGDDCPWCVGCTCPDEAFMYLVGDVRVGFDEWVLVDRDERSFARVNELACSYCTGGRVSAPNFLHKPSGTRISWYKYIGRGMEVDLQAPWTDVFADCVRSVQAH